MDNIFSEETASENQTTEGMHTNFKTAIGLLLLGAGAFYLLPALGVVLPPWLFRWEMLFVAAGLFSGVAWRFRGLFWLLLILVGFALLVDDIFPGHRLGAYGWPVALIVFGLYFIFGRKKDTRFWGKNSLSDENSASDIPPTGEDYVEGIAIFGQVRKKIISKNFQGGDVVAIFGGARIDLTQADMKQVAELEMVGIFGGIQLVVPAHWKVRTETAVIFGGVDDKRIVAQDFNAGTDKEIILRGVAVFGGIEIRSF
jgi:predicted membrane protein